MNIVEAIVLGLVQGLTEFIPVSSSGHLVIAQLFFSGASDHLFIEFINFGTLLALLIYFRKRILAIIKDVFVSKNIKLARNIVISAVPAGLVGFFLSDFIETNPFFGSMVVVTVTLAVVGILMVVLEKLPKASPIKEGQDLNNKRALGIGLAQVFALIPGVSRSGSTIIAGRLAGLNAAAAAEYSFLVSLPIMFGVVVKLLAKESDRAYLFEHFPMLLVGNTAAFISGLVAVGFLMRYLAKHSLAVFGWYRIGLAGILVVVLLIQ
jgi:undecaprenyl-diphosphatase